METHTPSPHIVRSSFYGLVKSVPYGFMRALWLAPVLLALLPAADAAAGHAAMRDKAIAELEAKHAQEMQRLEQDKTGLKNQAEAAKAAAQNLERQQAEAKHQVELAEEKARQAQKDQAELERKAAAEKQRLQQELERLRTEQAKPDPAALLRIQQLEKQNAELQRRAEAVEAEKQRWEKQRAEEKLKRELATAGVQSGQFQTEPTGKVAAPSTLIADRYQDNGDGTVTDVKTRLQWMRCSLGQTWRDGGCTGNIEKGYKWQAALDAAKALNHAGGYASYRDWRVPSQDELRTLVYCSSGQPKTWNDTGSACQADSRRPTIVDAAFPSAPPDSFWSASVYANYPDDAWYVSFSNGSDYRGGKYYDFAVRLVRGGQ